jgi:NAD(P)-dependent dehydrogenase (short-subunit alcohol dehydrogenase family)
MTLAREGADLALAARDVPPLETLAHEIEALGRRALVAPCDVTHAPAVQRVVTRTIEAFGRIDILVNAAGVTGPVETPVQDIMPEDFKFVLDTNVVGTFLPIKYVLPGMIARRYGKIVNISGTSGLRGYKLRAAYSSSKWALRGLTRTVALEAGPYNINVNALHPGIVAGDRMDRLCREKAKKRGSTPEQVHQEYVNEMALRRVTTAQDIANAVLFLVSDDSANMTGQSVTVDGGWDV